MRTIVLASVCCVLIGVSLAAEIFNCKEKGETCRGMPKCCGSLVCRTEGKWNPFVGGTCSECGRDGERCVGDAQCCQPLQCDKEKVGDFNGYCRPRRPPGATCYSDSQCNGECNKKWYKLYGHCSR